MATEFTEDDEKLLEKFGDVKKEPGDCCPDCKTGVEHGRLELFAAASKHFTSRMAQSAVKPVLRKSTHHQVSFICEGKAGERVVLEKPADAIFRGEKMIMLLTPEEPKSVRIRRMEIGNKSQIPSSVKELWADDFPANSLACEVSFSIMQPEDKVLFEIEFFKDCEWSAYLLGRAVLR